MNAVADFPRIEVPDDMPAAITPVAAAASTALDLRKIDLTDVALAQFGDWRAEVAAVKANLSTLALDLTTQSKVDEAKSLRWRLIGIPRAAARSTSKTLKSTIAKVSKAIGATEDAIVLAYDEAESLITPHIDARQAELDAEKERERAAKAEAARLEAERVQRHKDGITTLEGYVARGQGKTAEQLAAGIAFVEKIRIDPDHWQEFTAAANATLAEALDKLRAMHADAKAREDQAAEVERLRVLAEQQAAELAALRKAEADRLARIAENERLAALDLARAAELQAEFDANCRLANENAQRAAAEREAREHAELEAERIAELTADAPKPADAELALAEAPLTVTPASEMTAVRSLPTYADKVAADLHGCTVDELPARRDPKPEADVPSQTAAFVALVLTAFNSKFPSQPKPSVEWWAEVRAKGIALQAKLEAC